MKSSPENVAVVATGPASDMDLAEGWVSALLPEVCEINPRKPPANTFAPDTPLTFVPMPAVDADAGAITAPETRLFSNVRSGFTAFREGDVIFAKITPCMENGKAAIARNLLNGHGFGSTEFHVLRSNGAVLPEFIYHFVRRESFRKEAETEMTGSVGQKRVPADFLRQVELPVAPLDEQRRIVVKIEKLLTQVNASRAHLARVAQILKRFRQGVLTAAYSGRLTADWREIIGPPVEDARLLVERIAREKQKTKYSRRPAEMALSAIIPEEQPWELPAGWCYERLGNLCSDVMDIDHKMPKAVDTGVKFISAKDLLDDGSLNLSHDIKLISEEDYARLSRKAKPQRNDIIYSRIGARLGKARLVETDERFLVSYSCCVIRPLIVFSKYVARFLDSGVVLARAREEAKSIGVPDLGLQEINRFIVPVPPILEQHEIVRRVETLFAHADAIEKQVEAARKRAEKLTQAILAKAFRGELVSTEAELARREGRDYEPATALLKRIHAEREPVLKSVAAGKNRHARGARSARRRASRG